MKKACRVLGFIAGIVITIMGINLWSKGMRFGADFYTEMYSITQEGVGTLVFAIGLFCTFYFGEKLGTQDIDVSDKLNNICTKLNEIENKIPSSEVKNNNDNDTLPPL